MSISNSKKRWGPFSHSNTCSYQGSQIRFLVFSVGHTFARLFLLVSCSARWVRQNEGFDILYILGMSNFIQFKAADSQDITELEDWHLKSAHQQSYWYLYTAKLGSLGIILRLVHILQHRYEANPTLCFWWRN